MTYPLTNPHFFDGLNGWTPGAGAGVTLIAPDRLRLAIAPASAGVGQLLHNFSVVPYELAVTYGVTRVDAGSFSAGLYGAFSASGAVHSTPGIYTDVFTITISGVTGVQIISRLGAGANLDLDYVEAKQAMAITSDGFELSVSLVDSGGDQSTLRYQLVAADMTAALAAASTILSRLDTVTDAVVKGYFVGERYTEDALSLPGSGVQVEQRATVICQIDSDPLKKVAINIPAPNDGLFVGGPGTGDGYNTIDTTDAGLALYADIWAVSGALATISDGEYLTDAPILRGRRTHRQSSRG